MVEIRRGTDVIKAHCPGARAVLVGRPILWGLAVNGADGVYHVLEILRAELEQDMILAGFPQSRAFNRSLVSLSRKSALSMEKSRYEHQYLGSRRYGEEQ